MSMTKCMMEYPNLNNMSPNCAIKDMYTFKTLLLHCNKSVKNQTNCMSRLYDDLGQGYATSKI